MPVGRIAACLVSVLLLTGCGGWALSSFRDAGTDAPAYERSADAVIVRVAEGAGFVPYEYGFQQGTPRAVVLGDGRLLLADEPGTAAWLQVREHRLDAAELARLLAAAKGAGLLSPPPDYGSPQVTDMGTTTVQITVDAGRFEHAAYGLGMDQGLGAAQSDRRKRLRGFIDRILAARPAGAPYVARRIAVLAMPSSVAGHGRRWNGPALAGQCSVLEGADAARAVALLRTARIDQDWRLEGESVHVVARPLLPGDAGCV